ncbi:MAG: hypothetical protein JW787_08110 [Sedimentisphaerales bacterium]|nr:hypothetical protein [Sedimentisphaerales bacterium]
MIRKSFISVLFLFLLSGSVFAHKPIWSDKPAIDANTAIVLIDPNISQVVYRSLPAGPNQIWTTLTAHTNFQLYVQIGVPVIERLKKFRPSLAVIGPGLPEPNLPFKIPSGFGAVVIDTNSVEPRYFYEPFTGTSSWILESRTIELTKAGRFYVTAFDPKQAGGKLWIAVGQKEKFGLADLLNMGQTIKLVRSFHEAEAISAANPNDTESENIP